MSESVSRWYTMPLGGASNKAQRAVVDKKAKKKGGADDEDVQAFKKKQMEDKKVRHIDTHAMK